MPASSFARSNRLLTSITRTFVLGLVENAFQLLADDKLEPEVWKNYRAYAKQNVAAITNHAIEEHASSTKR